VSVASSSPYAGLGVSGFGRLLAFDLDTTVEAGFGGQERGP
jgi:hypothetical protein